MIQRETLFEMMPEMEPLLHLHHEELNDSAFPLDPIWSAYVGLENDGRLAMFSARDKDGSLIGYAAFFLTHHLHHADMLCAVNDVVFLHPEHRQGRVGIQLFQYCEEQLKALGVHKITWSITPQNDFSAILHRLGYVDQERVVGKYLNERGA